MFDILLVNMIHGHLDIIARNIQRERSHRCTPAQNKAGQINVDEIFSMKYLFSVILQKEQKVTEH